MKAPSICMLLCLTALYLLAVFNQLQVAQARIQRSVISNPSQGTERARKSRIFIIGATGKFGRYVVEASVKAQHYTVALVRLSTIETDAAKKELVDKFESEGVQIVYGDFNIDREIVVNAMKRVDVVISCVSGIQVPDQVNITSAIQLAGNIKRFLPSEYAIDVDRVHDPVEPAKSMFENKAKIRRLVESLGIPHTFVVANGFAGRFWPNLAQVNPPTLIPNIQNVEAFGDGNSMIIATAEEDVATYIIKTVDDRRTLNKILYLRPPRNTLSYNDLFALWERKSGKTLDKTYISEEQLLETIVELGFPNNILLSVCYSVAIKNDYASYKISPSFGVEASKRYPEVKYKTVSQYFDEVLSNATFSVLSEPMETTFFI